MNLTTSSYVDVDLNAVDSAVVLRSASGDGACACATIAARAHAAPTANTRDIRESSAAILLHCNACHGYRRRRRTGDLLFVGWTPGLQLREIDVGMIEALQ